MRRLLKFSLRNLMQQFPRQNYCIYRHVYNINLHFIPERFNKATTMQYNYSTVSFPRDIKESSIAELKEEFPEPKKILYQVLNEAFLKDQTLDLKPSVLTEQIFSGSNNEYTWKATLQFKWPEVFEVEALAKRKTEALNISFLYACQKLKHLGVLDQSNNPVLQKQKISDRDINTAKGELLNLFQKIWHRFGKKDLMPKFNTKPYEGLFGNYWQTELEVTYPEKKVFKAAAFRSSTSEGVAAFEALVWLYSQGIITKKRRLLDYTKDDEEKLKEYHQAPHSLCIPPDLQEAMRSVLSEIENQRLQLSDKEKDYCIDSIKEESLKNNVIRDIITSEPYYPLTDEELLKRNQILYEKKKNTEKKYLTSLSDIKKGRSLLPIFQRRDDILKLIEENQVVILSGDTGCGKSTQVPQFILEHYIENMKGAECNIIVTQPRRISAVALADRVAKERDEKVGDVIGHQIRFNKCIPEGNGAVYYCTTGLLLRKLLTNPNLEGISHVIIDEIHERNIQIDFILILLKEVLETNKNIKVLLMSASFNTNIFAQYFNNSKIIHIPGKMYPVEEFFLEDLIKDIPSIKNVEPGKVTLDVDLIVDVINYIDKKQPPGAVLCFLPGWHEIKAIQDKLVENQESNSKLMICPIHSRLPHDEQKNIFLKPPDGQRKIILATNIAETSITIDDVVYVVDSGLQKGTLLDVEVGIASLSTQWVTKANVRQRKGRAGRVKPGKCYHLFSWKTFMRMEEYPVPEILRIPLESVILDCKLFSKNIKAEEFLSKGLQSPSPSAIQNGVNDLQVLGLLDESENLTDLGNRVAHFSSHPRISVALVYASFLGCLDPVLTICAILTLEKEPFLNTLDDKIQVKKIKANYDNGLYSDHLSLTKIYDTWRSLSGNDVNEYLEKNLLDEQSLICMKKLRELFVEDLYEAGFISNEATYFDTRNPYNVSSSHVPSILTVLTAAFFPNVIKILQGEISQGKLNRNSLVYSIVKGPKAYIQKESVASDEEFLPSPWLIYFSALKSEARRKALVSCVSSIPGICLLLAAGRDICMSNMDNEKNQAILSIGDYKYLQFSCTAEEARLLLDWRECLYEIFKLYLQYLKVNCKEREYMISCSHKFIPVLKELLGTPQVPFTKGQVHEFINNELISKELQI